VIDLQVDSKLFKACMARVPTMTAVWMRRGFAEIGAGFMRDFRAHNLKVIDDRNPDDPPLFRRPASSMGLVTRSGGLGRSMLTRTTGAKLADLQTKVGWLSGRYVRIARVHELGTVGKGGSLPDIRPRKGPFLWVRVRALGAALSNKFDLVPIRKAAIPPRMGLFKQWSGRDNIRIVNRVLQLALQNALNSATRKTGP